MNTSDASIDFSAGLAAGHLASPSTGLASGAARYFVDLGWSREEAEIWFADTASLAGFTRGGTSAAAAKLSASSAPEKMLRQVYRELEMLERQGRGRVLAEVTGRLARRAATLGSAGLELIAGSAPHASRALVRVMESEFRRSKSHRLLEQLRSNCEGTATSESAGTSETAVSADDPSPSEIAIGLSQLARRLTSDDGVWLVMVEVALAFGDAETVRNVLLAQLDDLPPVEDGETVDEAAMRERCMRLLALAHFLLGENEQALELMGAMPLVLDRTASMGTLRAAAEFRLRQQAGNPAGFPAGKSAAEAGPESARAAEAPRTHDEFAAPVSAEERRSVARFLCLAHGSSVEAIGDESGDSDLWGAR